MKTYAEKLTDEEINQLLERFDKTDPAMQRKIIAQLVIDAIVSEDKFRVLENDYHELMQSLRNCKRPHGDCSSGTRYGGVPKACSACMANRHLEESLKAYKGRMVKPC